MIDQQKALLRLATRWSAGSMRCHFVLLFAIVIWCMLRQVHGQPRADTATMFLVYIREYNLLFHT
jgi:hypothetical protein